MAASALESLAAVYVKDLNAAASFLMSGKDMYLDLMYDTSTMKFSK